MQASDSKESLENSQNNKGVRNKNMGGNFSLIHQGTRNSEHSLTHSQINIKPHTKGSSTSVPFYPIHMSSFQ